jgi:hypothetical protein
LLSIKFGPEKGPVADKQVKAKEPSMDSIDALGTLTIGDDGEGKYGKYFGPSAGSEVGLISSAAVSHADLLLDLVFGDQFPLEVGNVNLNKIIGRRGNGDVSVKRLRGLPSIKRGDR